MLHYTSESSYEKCVAIQNKMSVRSTVVRADMASTDCGQVIADHARKEFGKVDIVVNNAGISINQALEDVDVDTFDKHMQVNVRGPLLLVKACMPLLQDGGRIINISSISSSVGAPTQSVCLDSI